jgi:hypothetical protein
MVIPMRQQLENKIIINRVFELEPKAKRLWNEALVIGMATPSFDNEDIFRAQFKMRLVSMVGFEAPGTTPEEIRTSEAYEALYRGILDALHCWAFFQEVQKIGRDSGYKPGWAAVQFKVRFGQMPRFPFRKANPYSMGGTR